MGLTQLATEGQGLRGRAADNLSRKEDVRRDSSMSVVADALAVASEINQPPLLDRHEGQAYG